MASIKVAIIQMYPEPLEMERNYSKAAQFIRDAAAKGAELAVLPEYHLTNWVPDTEGFHDACRSGGPFLKRYQALAKEYHICIVPGTIVEEEVDEDTKEVVYRNSCYFISNDGSMAGRYRKKNLWIAERPDEDMHLQDSENMKLFLSKDFSPHEVYDTPIGPVGMLICWDLAFPEAFRILVQKGAKIIIIPCFWTLLDCTSKGLEYNRNSEALFIDSAITAMSFMMNIAIVFVNAGGGEGFAGLSQVTMPFTGPLDKFQGPEEGMKVVDVDMAILDEAERNYKIREDLASPYWHYRCSDHDPRSGPR